MNFFWIWQIQKLEQVHPVSVPTLPASETINQTFKNMIYWKTENLHATLETKVYTSDPQNDIFEKVYTSDSQNDILEKVYTSDPQNAIFEKVYTFWLILDILLYLLQNAFFHE